MKPIKPDELGAAIVKMFPHEVFAAVNECVVANWTGHQARFTQNDVMNKIIEKLPALDRNNIFELGYLNFEEAYRAEGWSVKYDKPSYADTYEANFVFKRKN